MGSDSSPPHQWDRAYLMGAIKVKLHTYCPQLLPTNACLCVSVSITVSVKVCCDCGAQTTVVHIGFVIVQDYTSHMCVCHYPASSMQVHTAISRFKQVSTLLEAGKPTQQHLQLYVAV